MKKKTSLGRRSQRGFTLVELGIVTIVLVVLVALAVPQIQSYIIAGRVPSSGQDLTKAIVQLKQQAATSPSPTPFATVPGIEKLLANTNFAVSGTTVNHSLGAQAGQVTLATVGTGASAAITVWGVHPAACPSLAGTLAKAADVIEIGQGGTADAPAAPAAAAAVPTATSANVVKIPSSPYSASAAQGACDTSGNHNYMRFYIGA